MATAPEMQCSYEALVHFNSVPARVLETGPVHCADEAAVYDGMVRRYAWMINQSFVDRIAKLEAERAVVLDVGTGPGWIPIELALRKPGWEFHAIDASEDMLNLARRNAAEAGVADRVHFQRGDVSCLPFNAGRFDISLSHWMLHHIEFPTAVFDEMARVTRGGGRIAIKDLCRLPGWKRTLLVAFARHVMRNSPLLLRMYDESIGAALTFDEVRASLKKSRLSMARLESFRGMEFIISA